MTKITVNITPLLSGTNALNVPVVSKQTAKEKKQIKADDVLTYLSSNPTTLGTANVLKGENTDGYISNYLAENELEKLTKKIKNRKIKSIVSDLSKQDFLTKYAISLITKLDQQYPELKGKKAQQIVDSNLEELAMTCMIFDVQASHSKPDERYRKSTYSGIVSNLTQSINLIDDVINLNGNDINEYLTAKDIKGLTKQIKNGTLKFVLTDLSKQNFLTKDVICLITEIDQLYSELKDERVKQEVDKILEWVINQCIISGVTLASTQFDGDEEQYKLCTYSKIKNSLINTINIIDAVNMLNDKYIRYQDINNSSFSYDKITLTPTENVRYYKENKAEIKNGVANILDGQFATLKSQDFMKALKRESFIHLIADETIDNDFANYLYKNYYLKNENLLSSSEQIKKQCNEINKKYNVKIFLSANTGANIIDDVEEELEEWTEKSKGNAVLPKVIDFNRAFDSFNNDYTKAVAYRDCPVIKIFPEEHTIAAKEHFRNTLRHELTHLNTKETVYLIDRRKNIEKCKDLMHISRIGSEYKRGMKLYKLSDQIIKTKQNGSNIELDFDNCKYREELLNAGITPTTVKYAYKNIKEFLAVAATGDMTKYSGKFKNVLKTLGIPEFIFNLEPTEETKMHSIFVETVKEDNPQICKYDELAKKVQEKLDEESQTYSLMDLYMLFQSSKNGEANS